MEHFPKTNQHFSGVETSLGSWGHFFLFLLGLFDTITVGLLMHTNERIHTSVKD